MRGRMGGRTCQCGNNRVFLLSSMQVAPGGDCRALLRSVVKACQLLHCPREQEGWVREWLLPGLRVLATIWGKAVVILEVVHSL